VFHDRATAVCTFIFAAQGALACSSLLQVLGMTDSKTLSVSFSSAATNLIPTWPFSLLAYSAKRSGWLAGQVLQRQGFLGFQI